MSLWMDDAAAADAALFSYLQPLLMLANFAGQDPLPSRTRRKLSKTSSTRRVTTTSKAAVHVTQALTGVAVVFKLGVVRSRNINCETYTIINHFSRF